MSQLCSPCMHVCENKTEYGYCGSTACINPRHNGSGVYVSNETKAINHGAITTTTIRKNNGQ